MPSYNLDISFYGFYLSDIPTFEIWSEGSLISSLSALSSETSSSLSLNYGGSLPTSLQFRFDDSFLETDRYVQMSSIKINDRVINTSNFIDVDKLYQNDTATLNITIADFLFDSGTPDSSLFTTNPTRIFTSNADSFRYINGSTDHVLDLLAGNDVIYLGAGHDKANGNTGNDIMYAGAGDDIFYGDIGDDRLFGELGDDKLYGGDGNDRLDGGDGNDQIFGGNDNDTLIGKNGADKISGGQGNDKLNGGQGNDFLYGDDGDDQIIAGAGHDTLDGGVGNDTLYGGNDNDVINGGTGDDYIIAGAGDDILYSDSGNDILLGQNGADTLYSGSAETIDALVTSILSNNVGVSYSADTNSFYQYVSTAAQWATAQSDAASATLTGLDGVNGHLVTITSETENNYITTLAGGSTIWIGASDASTEGQWRWTAGPETGQQFWQGNSFGSDVNSMYSNWSALQPTVLSSMSDYASLNSTGNWVANTSGASLNYIVEWEASSLISSVNNTVMNGGDDLDILYGDGGIDIFILDNINNRDQIYNYDVADRDALDLSNLVSYHALTDDINDFVRFTESIGDTIVSVDIDGTDNGVSFTDIACLNGVTGLDDIQLLLAGDNLIV